jgi:DNA-directed RNA polymerase specialized sigma24 family protein
MTAINETQIRDLLNRLPSERLRRTCHLVWLERRSLEHVAATQGIGVFAVQRRLQRARERLRKRGLPAPDARRNISARRSPAFQLSLNDNV